MDGQQSKFAQLFLYAYRQLSVVEVEKILAVLYLSDLEHYIIEGKPISDMTWVKGSERFPDCPVPKGFDDWYKDMLLEIGLEELDANPVSVDDSQERTD